MNYNLNDSDLKILTLLSQGYRLSEIETEMSLKKKTLQGKMRRIYDKTYTLTMPHAVATAIRNKIIT